MTDEEIICTWMEAKPGPLAKHPGNWWVWGFPGDEGTYPKELTLDAIWKVEERLTDNQACAYHQKLDWATKHDGHNSNIAAAIFPWHATAEQKVKALAAVLRPVVEARP